MPATPDIVLGGNGEPTRITVRPEAPKPVERPMSILPSSVGGAVRDFGIGSQGVAKGLLHTAAMPFDLAAGAVNLGVAGANKLFGTNWSYATPASQMAETAAAPLMIPRSEMSPSERLFENVNDFATQGLTAGTALAARAPQLATRTMPSTTISGRVFDTVTRPYTAAPATTVTGDAVVGAGAGTGASAAQEYAPDSVAANIAAPFVGGVGAAGLQAAATGIGGLLRSIAAKSLPSPREIPVNLQTSAPYTNPDIDRAARTFQASAHLSPKALAQDIRENAAELLSPKLAGEEPLSRSSLPTTGMLSGDPGLLGAEGGARMKNAAPFIQRDENIKGAAAGRVASLRDPEADLGSVFRAADAARESKMAAAEGEVARRAEELATRQRDQELFGADFGAIANSDAKANASRNLDRAVVDQNYVPARQQKNEMFDNAPGRNEQLPSDDVFAAIDRVRASANGLAPGTLPNDFMRRLDALRPQIDPETGANIGGPGTASGADLADLRKFVSTARENAQRSGNFDLADNLGQLQRSLNRTIENAPGYAEANANYGQFAERFRPERNDEGARFTRDIDRGGQQPDGTLNRGNTPPSETAGRFLSSPEKAAALNRMMAGAPSEQAGQTAVRDYMRSDFATSVLNSDGTINPARAAAWTRNNADVLSQFPTLRGEFDSVVAEARRGQQLSTDAKAFLDQARKTAKATEADIDRGAIGTLLRGEDPRDVAAKLLNGGWSSEKRLDEINALVKNDEAAKRGWKAAFADELHKRVTGTKQTSETYEVRYARLAAEFKANEKLMAKVFSPEEMGTLRQAHKLLGYFKEAEKRATVGSQTAERVIPRILELGARHIYGDLKGGGIVRRFRLMLELMPSNKQAAEQIVQMAWFNPDVAAYLLERPVRNPNVPQHNINLRRLIALDNAARQPQARGK